MHRTLRSALWAAVAFATGCGGGATVIATTPIPDDATSHPTFAVPASSLRIAAPRAPWSPEAYGSNESGRMLAEALKARASAMIVIGSELDAAADEERIVRMVKAASPGTAVVARARATLDRLMEERGEIPYRVTEVQGGVDAFGQPYFVPREHPLSTDWLLKKRALKGAEALLTVRRVVPDAKRLAEMRRARRGGCAEALAELGAQRQEAIAYFGDLGRQADDALAKAFSRQLEKALPFFRAELDEARERAAGGDGDAACVEAYRAFVSSYEPCASGECGLGPRFHLAAGGIVAMDDGPASSVPTRCASGEGRDYVREIRDAGARAAAEIFGSFPASALADIVRFGAFDDAVARFADFCEPRHRRFTETEIESFRADLNRLFESLEAASPAGEIAAATGLERVAGIGPVRVLGRVRSTGTDLRSEGIEMFGRFAEVARCQGGTGDSALQAAVVDVGTSEVAFMGLFFEEQLLCEDLPPSQP